MTVAGRLIALAAADVVAVLPMLPLWRPPTSPAPLRGFVDAGTGVLPVLSARALLGLGGDAAPSLYAHIVSVKGLGAGRAGLLVDRAEDLVAGATLKPLAAAETLNGCAAALFARGAEVGWLLDLGRLLAVAESEALAALAAEAERRRGEWGVEA